LHAWLEALLLLLFGPSTLAEAIRYALARSHGLTCFLRDGRVELDTNPVDRAIRPAPALQRRLALVARQHCARGHVERAPDVWIAGLADPALHVDRGT
jgi:Transposase IS66 family